MKYRRDLFYLLLLLGLAFVFWGEALAPGKMFYFRDIYSEILAKKYFWSGSSGPTLWFPFDFFGIPYASNPQAEAFYFPNFMFSILGPERGVVYDVVFYHLLFLSTFYLALRKIGFKEEASLIGSIGFGFGGYLISLGSIPLFFRTIAWLGLLIICLDEALETKWLRWTLWLGLVMAVQILGGEIQLAGMSWVLAFGMVALAPRKRTSPRDLFRASGAMALGLVWGVILILPQIALTGELVTLSNRAGGMNLSDAMVWSLAPSQLISLIVPNYLLPSTAGQFWGLGFFHGFPYFLSHYLGVTLLLMVVLSWAGPGKWRGLFWLALALFGLVMILGDSAGVYTFFYKHLPGFNLFRFPEKFFLFLNFGSAMLAVYGYEYCSLRRQFSPWGSGACFLAAAVIIILLLIYPLRIQEFKDNYHTVTEYLYWRNILRVSMFFLLGLGLVLSAGKLSRGGLGLGLALVLFGDLFFAHYRLNPVTKMEFFQPNEYIKNLLAQEKDRIVPPRIFSISPPKQDLILQRLSDPVLSFKDFQNSLESGWAVYFGLNNIRWAGGTFYPKEVSKFKKIIGAAKWPDNDLILARAGVEYLYYRDRGFTGIPGAFPRAMVFYQARALSDQDQIIKLWSTPDFPAEQVLLVETEPEKLTPGSKLMKSEPAAVMEYQNEKVAVEAEAREAGWLLLLDSYYPGWKAEVDGRPGEIYRGDGFFRAVKIPQGKHRVVFHYYPAVFRNSVGVSATGLLAWLGLMVFSFVRSGRQEKNLNKF
ncbi:MAG: YfhO family protein [bacterium]|nr:YfhO family protein [bacterium]